MSDDRHDRVSRRAYELWQQEGGAHGRHEEHWHRAAAEIEDVAFTAPDGTTLTGPADDEPVKAARKRAAPASPARADAKPADPGAADKAPSKPRKPRTK